MVTLREELTLEAYDQTIGLQLSDVAVDCCITKAPCGGQKAGRNPVDRGKQGIKRSMVVDAKGIPLGAVAAPAKVATTPRSWSKPSGHFGGARRALPEQMSVHLEIAATTLVVPERS